MSVLSPCSRVMLHAEEAGDVAAVASAVEAAVLLRLLQAFQLQRLRLSLLPMCQSHGQTSTSLCTSRWRISLPCFTLYQSISTHSLSPNRASSELRARTNLQARPFDGWSESLTQPTGLAAFSQRGTGCRCSPGLRELLAPALLLSHSTCRRMSRGKPLRPCSSTLSARVGWQWRPPP